MNINNLIETLIEYQSSPVTPDKETLAHLMRRSLHTQGQRLFEGKDDAGEEFSVILSGDKIFLSAITISNGSNKMYCMRESFDEPFTVASVSGDEDFVFGTKMSERPKIKPVASSGNQVIH
jgi:hypothetical protein